MKVNLKPRSMMYPSPAVVASAYDENGKAEMRETVELGLTIDERIADGYYYAKTVKLLKYLLQNPELLEQPLNAPVDFE